jgi:hypothetical protein
VQLRGLRAQEFRLLNTHRYDESELIEREGDRLEAEESIVSVALMESDFAERLESRHQAELDTMNGASRREHFLK